jgi:hypothetical protein
MARNALAIPYGWLVRPRMAVYAWIPVEHWVLPGSLDIVLRGFTALLAVKLLSGLVKIRRRLPVDTVPPVGMAGRASQAPRSQGS